MSWSSFEGAITERAFVDVMEGDVASAAVSMEMPGQGRGRGM